MSVRRIVQDHNVFIVKFVLQELKILLGKGKLDEMLKTTV